MVERSALKVAFMLLSLKLKAHWRRGNRKAVRAGRWGGGLGGGEEGWEVPVSSHVTDVVLMTKSGLVNSQSRVVEGSWGFSPPHESL